MNSNSTIVTAFLSAYERGGVACNAVEAVRELHDLGVTPRTKPLPDQWQHYYSDVLPKQVKEQTEAFDFSTVNSGRTSQIIAEIDRELRGLAGDERERYLFSLLTPFSELAKIYHPTAEVNRLQQAIKDTESDKAMWESQPQDKELFDVNGKPAGTPKEQAAACNKMIEQYRGYIERLKEINRRFCDVVLQNSESGTIEGYCGVWVRAATNFADRLDALLLTYGVDLLQLQETSGIYLKYRRVITDVDYYIGSFELAQHYINALPSKRAAALAAVDEPATADTAQQQSHPAPAAQRTAAKGGELPSELDTEQAKKYFARAVNAGLMSEQFEWKANKALLACFCREMSVKLDLGKGYNSEGQKRLCWKPFERLFKQNNLRASLNNLQQTGSDPTGSNKIDEIFAD